MLEYIATGTGRCGTRYVSRVLSEVGIPCGHESIFQPKGIVKNDRLQADSSWLAAPYLNHDIALNVPVIHVKRHPVDVVSSYVHIGFFDRVRNLNCRGPYALFARRHDPDILYTMYANPIAAAVHWVDYWTKKVASMSKGHRTLVYCIEDDIEPLLAFVGGDKKAIDKVNRLGKNCNSRGKHQRILPKAVSDKKVRLKYQELVDRYAARA